MVRKTLFAVLLLGGTCSPAAAQQFNRRLDPLGQHEFQIAWSVEVNNDSTVLVIGSSPWTDSVSYSSVITTVLLDPSGQVLLEDRWEYPWSSTYPGWSNASDRISASLYCIGSGTVDSAGTNRAALFVMASDGDQQWLSEHGMATEDWVGRQGKHCPDGGFIVVGETSVNGTSDACLFKFDSAGNVLWTRIYGGNFFDGAVAVDHASTGGYFVGGIKGTTVNTYRLWVFRTDSIGDVIWQKIWAPPFNSPNAHLISASDGHVLVASAHLSSGFDAWPYMAKLDSADGTTIWEHTYGNAAFNTTFFAVKELPQGGLIAVGQSRQLTNGLHSQGMLVRTNNLGDSLWQRYYYYADSLMTDGQGTLRDVMPTPDGGFVAVGAVIQSASGNNPPQYNQDMWVLKVDSMGCLVPGCDGLGMVQSQITNLRDALRVAPNPASTSAQLTWQLPAHLQRGNAQLSIVNASGAVYRTEPLDLSRGTHTMDVSTLAGGVYYLHVVSDGTWVTGTKLIVE